MFRQTLTVAEAVPVKAKGYSPRHAAHYGKDTTEGSYYHKETFTEVIVEDVNGKTGYFDRMQSNDAVDFIRTCEFPIRLELARYQPGTGLTFKYTTNKRRSSWMPQKPDRKRVLVDHIPETMGEKMDTANRMSEADIPYVITAKMMRLCVNTVIKWHSIFRRQAATVDGTRSHDRTTTNQPAKQSRHLEPSREDHPGACQAGEHAPQGDQEAHAGNVQGAVG